MISWLGAELYQHTRRILYTLAGSGTITLKSLKSGKYRYFNVERIIFRGMRLKKRNRDRMFQWFIFSQDIINDKGRKRVLLAISKLYQNACGFDNVSAYWDTPFMCYHLPIETWLKKSGIFFREYILLLIAFRNKRCMINNQSINNHFSPNGEQPEQRI